MARTNAKRAERAEDQGEETVGAFEGSLKRSMDTAKKPEIVPSGLWLLKGATWKVETLTSTKENGNDGEPMKSDVYTFIYDPYEPGEDVDPEALATGLYKGKRLTAKKWVHINDDRNNSDFYYLAQFIAKHGIDISGRTVEEALNGGFKGSFIYATVEPRSYENKNTGETILDNDLKNFSSASETSGASA